MRRGRQEHLLYFARHPAEVSESVCTGADSSSSARAAAMSGRESEAVCASSRSRWPATIGIVLSINLTALGLSQYLPADLWWLALVGGAAAGALVIFQLCGMSLARALRAASYYLGIRLVIALAFSALWNA